MLSTQRQIRIWFNIQLKAIIEKLKKKECYDFYYDSHHLWKISISEVWCGSLSWSFLPWEHPPRTPVPMKIISQHPFPWSRSLWLCLHHIGCAVSLFKLKLSSNYGVPRCLIYCFFLTPHCVFCKLYFSMFLQSFFNSRCYQCDQSLKFWHKSPSGILWESEAQQLVGRVVFQHLRVLTLSPSINVAFNLESVNLVFSHIFK